MCWYRLLFISAIAFPITAFAQVTEKGDHVTVPKGSKLCTNVMLDTSKGVLDPGRIFWRVTSNPRTNGTQSVASFVLETEYDRQSGNTTIKETRYDEDYATFFKRDPDHKGMFLMVSPQDGRVDAIVEVCRKKK